MEEMFLEKIAQSKSSSFIVFISSFILGISIASFFELERKILFWVIIAFFFGGVVLILNWHNQKYRLIIIGGILICLGMCRFLISEPPVNKNNLSYYLERNVYLEGYISEEVSVKNNQQQLIISANKIRIGNQLNSKLEKVNGNILASIFLYPEYKYGDKLMVQCDLVKPMEGTESAKNYAQYLQRQGIWSICINTSILQSNNGKGNYFYYYILKFKNYLALQINKLLPEPQSSFLGGLLYGAKTSLPADLIQAFNRTGTTHIIAISGYNITILAAALAALLKGLRIPRKKTFWIVVSGILFFVIMTGASASVVRAGIMGLIVLYAKQIGRLSQIGRMIIFTAFLMLLANPRILFFDVGFQLSFTATLGLIYISPILENYFIKLPSKFGIKESLLSTIAAIIATTPLILYSFGRFSTVAPLVNILILPTIPYTMAVGFAAVVASIIFMPLGQVIAWITWLPLTYIIKTVEWFASFGWSSIELPKLTWWMLALIYAVMIKVVYKNLQTNKENK